MEVREKVVIITGASQGIGLATARVFAREGARVVLVARSEEVLRDLAGELERAGSSAIAIPADVRDEAQVRKMVERVEREYGRIDVLINNAGQAAAGSVIGLRDDYYRRIIDINVFGPIYAMRAVVPIMRRQGGGIIVNVSSTVAYLSLPFSGHYASTKAALDVLSRTARVELERDNIPVITFYPNLTATNLNKNALGEEDRSAATPKLRADSPEKAAEKILEGVREERREKFADGPLRFVVTAAKLAPGLVERVILKRAQRSAAREPGGSSVMR